MESGVQFIWINSNAIKKSVVISVDSRYATAVDVGFANDTALQLQANPVSGQIRHHQIVQSVIIQITKKVQRHDLAVAFNDGCRMRL